MVKEDILKVKDVIDDKIDKRYLNNYFLRLYLFSNENLSGYLRNNNYHNKSVLTTGSSGDQALNLINYGCTDITHFDINPFCKYYFDLKRASILSLSRDSFCNFFLNKEHIFKIKKSFNVRTYNRIKDNLDIESKIFWDYVFYNFDLELVRKNLFMDKNYSVNNLIRCNEYLNIDNYYNMRKKLDKYNIKFITGNFINMNNNNYDKYNYIILSNILDYVLNLHTKLPDELMDVFPEYIELVKNSNTLLKEDGINYFHYVWDIDNSDFKIFMMMLSEYVEFSNIYVTSTYGSTFNDSVFCYDKGKKLVKN